VSVEILLYSSPNFKIFYLNTTKDTQKSCQNMRRGGALPNRCCQVSGVFKLTLSSCQAHVLFHSL